LVAWVGFGDELLVRDLCDVGGEEVEGEEEGAVLVAVFKVFGDVHGLVFLGWWDFFSVFSVDMGDWVVIGLLFWVWFDVWLEVGVEFCWILGMGFCVFGARISGMVKPRFKVGFWILSFVLLGVSSKIWCRFRCGRKLVGVSFPLSVVEYTELLLELLVELLELELLVVVVSVSLHGVW